MQPSLTKLAVSAPILCRRTLRNVRLMSSTTLTLKNNTNAPGNSSVEISTPAILQSGKWDLYVGLCLERKPVVTKELTQLEKEYAKCLAQQEMELSKKSDHEVRHERDKHLIERIKEGKEDQGTIQTAQDFEYLGQAELQEFEPASRTTEADKTNDTKSLDRSLQSHLLFAVSQKLGDGYKWILPQVKRAEGETLRQTADRALSTYCPTITARILGNAPWGYYKYKYPKETKDETTDEGRDGAKVFFYKAQFLSGEVKFEKDKLSLPIDNYGWLTRAELPIHFHPRYFKAISGFLIPEY